MKDAALPQVTEGFAAGGIETLRKHGVGPFADPMN
jgi:hypothetical protein